MPNPIDSFIKSFMDDKITTARKNAFCIRNIEVLRKKRLNDLAWGRNGWIKRDYGDVPTEARRDGADPNPSERKINHRFYSRGGE
ncbi:hypothetical protein AAMO2058_001165200 [Amorphochlora amoebiformis]|mmetsp:Transcript_18450/g.29424  ORF Transcript_18450/g.29424 Transcript_18450/m.29424 type:complete len:85 (-) Transcript_18450:156-410(-)|eukprot:1328754-Amorphochlora_amoeboformis.AAC.1